jgi:hypothetical protein
MRFQKKPIVVEAVQMDRVFQVETIEGVMTGNPGDWLITGVEGEQYPCKDSIFKATYESVDAVKRLNRIGATLAILAAVVSATGAFVNNVWLDPILAREIWLLSNPILFAWALGLRQEWWSDGLGPTAIALLYGFYTITGVLSFVDVDTMLLNIHNVADIMMRIPWGSSHG